MDNQPAPQGSGQTGGEAGTESLQPRTDEAKPMAETTTPLKGNEGDMPKLRKRTYRPSHRATFIGLAAVVLILGINAAIIGVVVKKGASKNNNSLPGQITISKTALSKIGVNSGSTGSSGVTLVVGPNAQFNGSVTVAGDTNIGGQLKLTKALVATDANLTQAEIGKISTNQLDVNGAATATTLSLRNNFAVSGTSSFQGAVNMSQLLTINNSANVIGNLAVGGVLSVSTFSARSLTSTSSLNVGGHIVTSGLNPGFSNGAGLGSNGTASISGDDAAGVISMGIGVNAVAGSIGRVTFINAYGSTPRITLTLNGNVNSACGFYTYNVSTGGFSVAYFCSGGSATGSNGLPAGGYSLSYIVEQ